MTCAARLLLAAAQWRDGVLSSDSVSDETSSPARFALHIKRAKPLTLRLIHGRI